MSDFALASGACSASSFALRPTGEAGSACGLSIIGGHPSEAAFGGKERPAV